MNQWLVWQLADSAFPSGGFAQSGGLEAAWQHGMVGDGESLASYLKVSLGQLNRGIGGFVGRSWESPSEFEAIDSACDLFLNNHVANRASRAQGRAFLAAAAGVFQNPSVIRLTKAIRQQQSTGHLAPVFGLICREIGVDRVTTTELFGFVFLRSQVSAAVRLGIIGPIEGQRIQSRLSMTTAVADAGDPVQIAPVLDLVQATQDRLYSRLFQS